jgi:hypothetical protein
MATPKRVIRHCPEPVSPTSQPLVLLPLDQLFCFQFLLGSQHWSLLSLLRLHQFSGNDFLFLWVPDLYPCLSYQLLTAIAHNGLTSAVLSLTHSLTHSTTLTPRLAVISHQLFYCRLKDSRFSSNGSWSSLYSLGTDHPENTALKSSYIVACVFVAAITQQRPLFTEQLLSDGYCIAAYFAVVA